MKNRLQLSRWRILAALLVVGVAAWLRLPAMRDLPYDIDERVYYPLAQRYARAFESGDWATLGDPFDNAEHPALVKLLFGAALASSPGPAPQNAPGYGQGTGAQPAGLATARLVSLIACLLVAGLLAWYNPLAGLAFAFSSWQIKYGVLAYLEAVPSLLTTGAMLLLATWWQRSATANDGVPSVPARQRPPAALIVSALLVGAAAAAKYPYAIIAAPTLALVVLWRWRVPWGGWRGLALVVGVAALGFYLFNPFMWRNPLGYLGETLAFHLRYSGNELVQSQKFAPWYNLSLLFKPMPYDPFFPFSLFNQLRIEGLLTTLGLLGLPLLWRRSPPLGLWLLLSGLFLLGWPTKWAHYTLMLIPPLSLSAGNLVTTLIGWLSARRRRPIKLAEL
ncbi:MAG: hypothetical protein H0T53_02815 [Herpetosiphonaceae bacterium]|nr:hypothetical protein [Herpetosiphonaceae bacterium]